jgi:SAM-dependent methyltransferase
MDEKMIGEGIKKFTWYSPVDFGKGVIAKGDFKRERTIDSIHFGLGKWKYIIERNLPDLQGKRVMDIGCNNGIFCIQMAKMGAVEVYGIDSKNTWTNWYEQAQFVKEALECRCNTNYPITYIDSAMEKIPQLNLGHFDVVIALCCLYYLEEDDLFSLLTHLKENSDFLLIQCNSRRQDQPPEVHRRAIPQFMGNALKKVGFSYIDYDKPLLYERPIVIGSRYPIHPKTQGLKIDRIRCWIRKKI